MGVNVGERQKAGKGVALKQIYYSSCLSLMSFGVSAHPWQSSWKPVGVGLQPPAEQPRGRGGHLTQGGTIRLYLKLGIIPHRCYVS